MPSSAHQINAKPAAKTSRQQRTYIGTSGRLAADTATAISVSISFMLA